MHPDRSRFRSEDEEAIPNSLRNRVALLPGTGRLRLVSGYFTVAGLHQAMIAALFAAAISGGWAQFSSTITPADFYRGVAAACLQAIGYFRTAHLVRRRRRDGAWMAVACFALVLLTQAFARSRNIWTLSISLIGLLLTTSVWPYLE